MMNDFNAYNLNYLQVMQKGGEGVLVQISEIHLQLKQRRGDVEVGECLKLRLFLLIFHKGQDQKSVCFIMLIQQILSLFILLFIPTIHYKQFLKLQFFTFFIIFLFYKIKSQLRAILYLVITIGLLLIGRSKNIYSKSMWGIQLSQLQNPTKSLFLPKLDIQSILFVVLVLLVTRIVIHKILYHFFAVKVSRPQHQINSLEHSYFYHLSIIILLMSDVNWNAYDLSIWVFSYACIGMIRKAFHIVKIQKQIMLNDYSYNNQIVTVLYSSKLYGLIIFGLSLTYFFWANTTYLGIPAKLTSLLLFPTLMLMTDSLFLLLCSIATTRDILCYYNQNINEIPPTYKLDLVHGIIGSSIRGWHYYNLLRLFYKAFLTKLEILDYMWILSVLNALYISFSNLTTSLKKYRNYNKLIDRMNRIFRKNAPTPDQICIICMDQLLNCRKLQNCGHLFHYKCLFQWVQTKYQCPVCRVPINLNF